jgi:hypothetical protein
MADIQSSQLVTILLMRFDWCYQEQNERLTTLVGKVTVEKEWLAKKAKKLGLI